MMLHDMKSQFIFSIAAIVAKVAGKWFDSNVYQLVPFEVTFCNETLLALFTEERLDSQVRLHVRKKLAALRCFVRAVF